MKQLYVLNKSKSVKVFLTPDGEGGRGRGFGTNPIAPASSPEATISRGY